MPSAQVAPTATPLPPALLVPLAPVSKLCLVWCYPSGSLSTPWRRPQGPLHAHCTGCSHFDSFLPALLFSSPLWSSLLCGVCLHPMALVRCHRVRCFRLSCPLSSVLWC